MRKLSSEHSSALRAIGDWAADAAKDLHKFNQEGGPKRVHQGIVAMNSASSALGEAARAAGQWVDRTRAGVDKAREALRAIADNPNSSYRASSHSKQRELPTSITDTLPLYGNGGYRQSQEVYYPNIKGYPRQPERLTPEQANMQASYNRLYQNFRESGHDPATARKLAQEQVLQNAQTGTYATNYPAQKFLAKSRIETTAKATPTQTASI